jgi:hypothetical protein
MLKNNDLLFDSELFEELNDQVSEQTTGGASLTFELDGSPETSFSDLLELGFKDELSKKIKSLFPNLDQNDNLALACSKRECVAKVDGVTKKFKL